MADFTRIVELQEHAPLRLSSQTLSAAAGELLWQQYDRERGVINVDFPSPKTGNQWQITSRGWVGHLPLSPDLGFHLRPKVPLDNLFQMLEYAYRLQSFTVLDGLTASESVPDFYRRLARLLARRVLERGRNGFHRAYLARQERLPYVRGQLDLNRHRPWTPTLACHYEEHTADIADNQILAWTLQIIAQSRLCDEATQLLVRRAYRSLNGHVSLIPFTAGACVDRFYTRLNQDYHPLHALCHFFLKHSGPGHRLGEHTMVPFLVNMSHLYEQFVAAWLEVNLPAPWTVRVQEQVTVGRQNELRFNVDLVLYDRHNQPRLVLDTKYKAAERPASADVQQITTYARLRDCSEAILVYPQVPGTPLDVEVGDVRLRTLSFSLEGDLEAHGQAFLRALALS